MTKFIRKNFDKSGEYVHYNHNGQMVFVARFKYRGAVTKARFITALTKLYSIEEYIERVKTEAPLKILMNDGHLEFDAENKKFIQNW